MEDVEKVQLPGYVPSVYRCSTGFAPPYRTPAQVDARDPIGYTAVLETTSKVYCSFASSFPGFSARAHTQTAYMCVHTAVDGFRTGLINSCVNLPTPDPQVLEYTTVSGTCTLIAGYLFYPDCCFNMFV